MPLRRKKTAGKKPATDTAKAPTRKAAGKKPAPKTTTTTAKSGPKKSSKMDDVLEKAYAAAKKKPPKVRNDDTALANLLGIDGEPGSSVAGRVKLTGLRTGKIKTGDNAGKQYVNLQVSIVEPAAAKGSTTSLYFGLHDNDAIDQPLEDVIHEIVSVFMLAGVDPGESFSELLSNGSETIKAADEAGETNDLRVSFKSYEGAKGIGIRTNVLGSAEAVYSDPENDETEEANGVDEEEEDDEEAGDGSGEEEGPEEDEGSEGEEEEEGEGEEEGEEEDAEDAEGDEDDGLWPEVGNSCKYKIRGKVYSGEIVTVLDDSEDEDEWKVQVDNGKGLVKSIKMAQLTELEGESVKF